MDWISVDDLWFGLATTVLAGVLILLDWALLAVKNRSVLGISYGAKGRVFILFAWSLASGAVAVFASVLLIVSQNFQGGIAVAVSWPILFEKFAGQGGEEDPIQQIPTGGTHG